MQFAQTALVLAAVFLGWLGTAEAQFTVNNSGNPTGPGIDSYSENVDFGDVDLDGDWDAVFADGGDDGNDQNRIWINRGGAQGGPLGAFLDETAMRLPNIQDSSRDVEFADFDNDGDIDLYIVNHSTFTNQGSRFWTNTGLLQGRTLGFYVDETAQRWVGLGTSPSSISPGLVLAAQNTFVDWSGDGDFGDLDNDGDLDLVHSSYGSTFGGNVPTRIFLNDGNGHFEEFNPSGFQLVGTNIVNGNPALWAEGLQRNNTTDSTGAEADIASSAQDIDLGDMDGDFDLDILHGAVHQLPRIFHNRLEATGSLSFRDVSTAVFPPNWAISAGHYEQEMGDFDSDGDLDILGINWLSFNDNLLRNDGMGKYTQIEVLPASSSDDNEGDFLDYDRDGDLDIFVANWSGSDKLYRNTGSGFVLQQQLIVIGNGQSLDADCVDFDADGDTDLLVAMNGFKPNNALINGLNVVDTHAPYLPRTENPGNQTAGPGKRVVRAQVYDNEAYYVTWYHQTQVALVVNRFSLPPIAARCSMGQIFRAELPGNLVGNVTATWSSTDQYGNQGNAAPDNYSSTTGAAFTSSFGVATLATDGQAPTIDALSVPFAGTTLYLGLAGAPNAPYFYYLTDASLPALPLPGLGVLNVAGNILLNLNGTLDAGGQAVLALPVGPNLPAGISVFQQLFTLNGQTDLLASSLGYSLTTQ